MRDLTTALIFALGFFLTLVAAHFVYERKFKKDPFCAAAPTLVALAGFCVFPFINLLIAIFALLYAFDDVIEKRE